MSDNKFVVRYLAPDEYEQWDYYVSRHPHGSVFHTSVFLKAVSVPVGRKFRVLALFRASNIIGGFALASFRKLNLNIIPLPYECPVFHPLISERESKFVSKRESFYNAALSQLLQHLKKHYDSFTFQFSPAIKDLRPYRSNGLKLGIHYTYWAKINDIDLQNPVFSPSTKRQIAKAVKNQYTLRKGLSADNLEDFYTLLRQTHTRQNVPLKLDKGAYINLLQGLSDKKWMELFILKFEDRPAAAFVIPVFNNVAYYWISTSDSELSQKGAPSALLVEVIEWLKSRGIEHLDLVGANTESVSRFKAGFNFKLEYTNDATYNTGLSRLLFGLKHLLFG